VRILTTSARLKTESKLGNNLQFENESVALGLRGVSGSGVFFRRHLPVNFQGHFRVI